jgi:hypothetical protein
MTEFAKNYDDVSIYPLDSAREAELRRKQTECTFIWTNKAGEPVGVIMSYLETDDGHLWLSGAEHRARFPAVRRDPRTCVVISSAGTDLGRGKTVTYKGRSVIHHKDDRKIKDWFYPRFAQKLRGHLGEVRIRQFVEFLDTPNRVVLEFIPYKKIVYDGDKMAQATPPVGA